ncbi:hypothetical protein BOX15_Mlig002238g1 [Macrostomum lignano]|uniref:cGMP-dependent protein kinase interacting domain-containing protein n=1 Tax=Macrostomum lignano TaxID=282301 RepID=A0A267GLS5_9PLAT|nr:hypothetical protein BOX15_Mlig002238g1 [Macrostomum lignano]
MERPPAASLTKNVHSRREQVRTWEASETNKASSKMRSQHKVKFQFEIAFLAACSSSDFDEITRLLQEDKVEINTSNIDGLTALHQACIDNKLELVRFLCEHGADLHARDKEGWTPLHATALGGHTEIAKYLIKRGASLTSANSDGDLPVDVAEQSEMRNLLRTGLPDVEEAAARNAEVAAMLADAIEWRRAGRYRDLRDPVANAGPLHVAAAKGYQQALAELLLCPGVPLEAVDNDGWTALHAAAHWGQAEACRMLVANGANMDALTNANQTVFDLADESVKPLLEELKVKQREIMQEKVMKRPAPVISTLKVEEGRAHSMRRSSVTRLPQSERHDLTLKGAEQEKHPEKLLQGNAVAPATTQSAGLPTAAAATSAVAPPGRSPLASSESLSSDDELRKSTAEARQQLQQPQQRRPTPSPPGFVITTTSESPPPPSQPPPPLPASQSPAPTSVASSSSPASGVVSAKRRIEIIPAGSAAAPTAPESATEAQTSRSKVRSILTRMESLQETSSGSSSSVAVRQNTQPQARAGIGGGRVRSAADALTMSSSAAGGTKPASGSVGLSASLNSPLVFPKTEPPAGSRLSQPEAPADRLERLRGTAGGRLANSVVAPVPSDQNGSRSSLSPQRQPPAAASHRRVSVIMEKEKTEESETERRRISRHNRATKRLTQGVTPDEVEQARKLMASRAAPADSVDNQPPAAADEQQSSAAVSKAGLAAGSEEPPAATTTASAWPSRTEEGGGGSFRVRPDSFHGGSSAAPATDYRRMFETEKIRSEQLERENGRMRREMDRMRRELETLQQQQQEQQLQQRAVINRSLAGYEAQERAAQAEAELNKLRLENSKLKADNTSLIRVISRLSTQSAAT